MGKRTIILASGLVAIAAVAGIIMGKFNKVFGYYFDVTNSYKSLVPVYFIRKQTLANSERYTTEELDRLAGVILGSSDKLVALEYNTYVELRDTLAAELTRVQRTAHSVAMLDALCSLSYVAVANGYVRPEINTDGVIDIKDGLPRTMKETELPEILMEHGVGLRNVRELAERYFGAVNIEAKGNRFKVTVMLQKQQ